MTIIWFLIHVNLNSWILEKPMEMKYLPIIRTDFRKSMTKKVLEITIDEHLHFEEHLTNVCKSASRKINALSRVSLFLAINRKRLCQALLSVDNSLNVLLFGCLLPLSLTEKPTKCMRDLYVYVIMITLRGITKFYANKIIQQLTIEIFRCPKVLFPPIMNKIFMLRNITFKINILRDINSRLPKIV